MLIRPSPSLPHARTTKTKRSLLCSVFFLLSCITVWLSVLCKLFLGPCRRLSSVGSRATEDLQGIALVQLRPPNGGYLGQMGVAKGGSCLSACGFASGENRCDAPRMHVLADRCPPVFGELLNRPAVCMQVRSRSSHWAPCLGACGVNKTPEALSVSSTYLERRAQSHNAVEELPRSTYKDTSEVHDDMRLDVLQMLPRQLPTKTGPQAQQAHFPSLPSSQALLPTSRLSACSCFALSALPRKRWDGTTNQTRPLVCKSNVSCSP